MMCAGNDMSYRHIISQWSVGSIGYVTMGDVYDGMREGNERNYVTVL